MTRYVRSVFAPALRPGTYGHLVYVLIGGLFGLGYLAVLGLGMAAGAAEATAVLLLLLLLGLPILLVVCGFSRALRDVERELANTMLGAGVPAPTAEAGPSGGLRLRLRAALVNPAAWRTVLWLGLRVSLGSLVLSGIGASAVVVAFGVVETVVGEFPRGLVVWTVPLGAALALGTLHFANLLAWIYRRLAMPLLGPSQAERLAALERRNEELAFRTRLARELHDSVGHTMTVAVLQAAAARKVFDADPEFALEALDAIQSVGRGALDELDRMLGVLRDEPEARGAEPGLQDVGALLARTRTAGLPVTVTISGDTETVPEDLGKEAYRIVQEGCTNVLRHAGLVPTDVSLQGGEHGLEVLVLNGPPKKTPPPPPFGGGRGLSGVAERVGALGGEFEAGPTEEGGYRLRALLPLGESE